MAMYSFYYDESEHSRKINHRTLISENYYDNFVVAIVGWQENYGNDLSNRFHTFEKKYAHRKSKGELKSSTIKQEQFQRGFASLSQSSVELLDDFLSLFDDNILIYFSVLSKIEFIIDQLFEGYENSILYDMDAMKYSIVKAIALHQPNEIIENFYDNSGKLIALLKKFFKKQIEGDEENRQLKEIEIEQYKQIISLLDDVSTIHTIDWDYSIPFLGFRNFVAEKSIGDYSLVIDREGRESNTLKAAKKAGIFDVSEADSIESFGIRMADMLVGIISKLMKALNNALKYRTPQEHMQKKILDQSWFTIDEHRLSLYKKLHKVLIDLNKAWYKSFAGRYSDDLVLLVAFLNYMSAFESSESLRSNLDKQGEIFNVYACESLLEHFHRMENKLPVVFVNNETSDYYLNRSGARVYFDTNMQPSLTIENDPRIYNVLSVGLSRDDTPLVTIEDANGANCYQLPESLKNWVRSLVELAAAGQNLLPAKVIFSKCKSDYYADIL